MKYIRKTARYNGKKYEATGKTELEAMTKLAEKLAAAKRGEEAIGGSMSVNAWFEQWLAAYKEPKGLTAKSLGMYREKYNGYIKSRIGTMKLRDVKDIHLQKIMNEQEGMSSSHAIKVRQVMQRKQIEGLWEAGTPTKGMDITRSLAASCGGTPGGTRSRLHRNALNR